MNVSPAAAERVRGLLAKSEPGVGLRVSLEKSGCAGVAYRMALTEPEPGDEVIDFRRRPRHRRLQGRALSARHDNGREDHAIRIVFRLREPEPDLRPAAAGESVELKEADPSSLAPTA
jgi:Uncharacterized conserved protein, COG0316